VSPVIVLGLVLMWAVVLVPMWLRRHDEVEESRSVDRFTAAMHTLSRYDDTQREAVKSHRSRSLDVHVSGASAPDAVAARRRRNQAQRRARSLATLVLTAAIVLVAAVVSGALLLWTLQVVLDVAIVSFLVHLRRSVTRAAAARRRAVRLERDRRQLEAALAESEPAEPRWEEGITVHHPTPAVEAVYVGSAARRATDELFDQTALDDEVVPAMAARAASDDGFFDQETDLDETVSRSATSFIETGAVRVPAPEVAPREAEPAAAAESVGVGEPWEPVPVPRPTYAMKPAAPPRPTRRPRTEPLLPPVEPVAEAEADDDLEAILDRRWAVND
jgi:hypothetical protein